MRRALLALMLLGAAELAAQVVRPEGAPERFNLYTGCSAVSLEIGFMKRKVTGMDALTREAVREAAETRLRAAGLLAASSPHQVYAGIGMIGPSLTVYVHFRKRLYDPLSGINGRAITWNRVTGGYSPSPNAALTTLRSHVDAFVNDYRKVNGAGCGKA